MEERTPNLSRIIMLMRDEPSAMDSDSHVEMPSVKVTYWQAGKPCCDPVWEAAYERFETAEQELRKFARRLSKLGVARWPRDWSVVELFCGRGNGLKAFEQLGFRHVEGIDLSPDLLRRYAGRAQLYVGDCRDLQFNAESKDVIVVQGGLHHLRRIPDDLKAVFEEVHRVLKPAGRIVIVEPWPTPFLTLVHAACRCRPLRKSWAKLDALAIMTEHELETYHQWIGQPQTIENLLQHYFVTEKKIIQFGKFMFVGHKHGQTD